MNKDKDPCPKKPGDKAQFCRSPWRSMPCAECSTLGSHSDVCATVRLFMSVSASPHQPLSRTELKASQYELVSDRMTACLSV